MVFPIYQPHTENPCGMWECAATWCSCGGPKIVCARADRPKHSVFCRCNKWAAFKGLPTCWLYMRFPLQYLGDGHNPLWEFLWSNWMEDRGLQVQGVKASRWSDTQLSHTPADPKRLSSPLGPVTSRCEPWRMMSRHGPGATALLDPVPAGQKPRMWPADAERNQRLVQPCDD